MLEIYDNLVDKDFIDNYMLMHTNPHFGWYMSTNTYSTVDGDIGEGIVCKDTKIKEGPQFVHTFIRDGVENSDRAMYAVDLLNLVCKQIGITPKPFRIKSNLCPIIDSDNTFEHQVPHVDFMDKHMAALYYVNDSDGPTYFFDEEYKVTKTVHPKQGRFILFDGDMFHAGSHPNKNTFRIVTNFNFTV